ALDVERRPVGRGGVVLRQRRDEVVAIEAEARRAEAMKLGEATAERRRIGPPAQLEPLEHELIAADLEHARHAQRTGAQPVEAVGLGGEARTGAALDEYDLPVALGAPSLVYVAAADPLEQLHNLGRTYSSKPRHERSTTSSTCSKSSPAPL